MPSARALFIKRRRNTLHLHSVFEQLRLLVSKYCACSLFFTGASTLIVVTQNSKQTFFLVYIYILYIFFCFIALANVDRKILSMACVADLDVECVSWYVPLVSFTGAVTSLHWPAQSELQLFVRSQSFSWCFLWQLHPFRCWSVWRKLSQVLRTFLRILF